MCTICMEPVVPLATLDYGGNHIFHIPCLQQLVAPLGAPVATGDQGPSGSLICYLDLPRCPECRRRFHLLPHVADPHNLDAYPNNYPNDERVRFYYDGQSGLTPNEVQTYVIDAQAADLALVVDDQQDDTQTDSGTETDSDDDGMNLEQDGTFKLGLRHCSKCGQTAEFLVYYDSEQYRREEPSGDIQPCPACGVKIDEDDENVVACMGCWALWHADCNHP